MDKPLSAEDFAAAEATARRLAAVFDELRDGVSPSRIVGADLSGATCFRRARRLMVFLCDTESLTLWSVFSRWWLIDVDGFRQIADWNLIRPYLPAFDQTVESPYIKFAVWHGRVRFGMRLGPNLYVSLEGERADDGSPVLATLQYPYRMPAEPGAASDLAR